MIFKDLTICRLIGIIKVALHASCYNFLLIIESVIFLETKPSEQSSVSLIHEPPFPQTGFLFRKADESSSLVKAWYVRVAFKDFHAELHETIRFALSKSLRLNVLKWWFIGLQFIAALPRGI